MRKHRRPIQLRAERLDERVVPAFGGLDPAFSDDGRQTVDFGGNDTIFAVGRQAQGADADKVVVAGSDGRLARLTSDGRTLDATFGDGTGFTGPIPNANSFRALVVLPDDRIVAVGDSNAGDGDYLVARFLADGTPDFSFNGTGFREYDFGGASELARDVALDPTTGQVVVVGNPTDESADLRAFRLTDAGAVDQSVGVTFGGQETAAAVLVGPDGVVYVVGSTAGGVGGSDFAVVRLNPADFTVDTAFGGPAAPDGQVTIDIAGGADVAAGAVLDSVGRLVIAGSTSGPGGADFAVVRLRADGTLDGTFGDAATPGKAIIDFGGADLPADVLLDSAGRVVLLTRR